jgi:hypothetical protein
MVEAESGILVLVWILVYYKKNRAFPIINGPISFYILVYHCSHLPISSSTNLCLTTLLIMTSLTTNFTYN